MLLLAWVYLHIHGLKPCWRLPTESLWVIHNQPQGVCGHRLYSWNTELISSGLCWFRVRCQTGQGKLEGLWNCSRVPYMKVLLNCNYYFAKRINMVIKYHIFSKQRLSAASSISYSWFMKCVTISSTAVLSYVFKSASVASLHRWSSWQSSLRCWVKLKHRDIDWSVRRISSNASSKTTVHEQEDLQARNFCGQNCFIGFMELVGVTRSSVLIVRALCIRWSTLSAYWRSSSAPWSASSLVVVLLEEAVMLMDVVSVLWIYTAPRNILMHHGLWDGKSQLLKLSIYIIVHFVVYLVNIESATATPSL